MFNETFKFNVSSSPSRKYFTSSTNRLLRPQVSYGDVMGKTLVFAVFDFDRFTKNDEIGEVVIVSVEGGSVTSLGSCPGSSPRVQHRPGLRGGTLAGHQVNVRGWSCKKSRYSLHEIG